MAPLQKLKTNNGNVLLEVLLCFPLIFIFLFLSGALLFVLTAQMGLHHSAHEALICVKREGSASLCRRRFYQDSRKFLPWGKITEVRLHDSRFRSEIRVYGEVHGLQFKIAREINWDTVDRRTDFLRY